ncbi:MAG: transglutaminase domain-containing protein [Anaerolineaceae bacterium]|nr:transglutaminase domain-containing protein [Anaerolineaceae bacterium]
MNAAIAWIWRRFRLKEFPWLDFLLTIVLLILFSLSFQYHKWLPSLQPLLIYSALGWVFGTLLSKTRWGAVWCALYSVLMIITAASQEIGEIIPQVRGLTFYEWVTQLNWQFFLFEGRVSGWFAQRLLREMISDPGWSAVVLIFELWICVSWFIWVSRRYKKIWIAVVPMLALLAHNIYQSHSSSFSLLVFLFIVLALYAKQYYQTKRNQWDDSHMDYPDSLWQDWLMAAFMIAAIALSIANYAPEVATPEGWQRINEWVEEIRTTSKEDGILEKPGEGTRSDYSDYTRPSTVHVVSGPDVNHVGSPLPQNDRLAMWIRVADPTPRHWRTEVYSIYTGSGWEAAEHSEEDVPSLENPIEVQLGYKLLKQYFNLRGEYDGQLFAAAEPVQVNTEEVRLIPILPDGSTLLRGNVTRYEVVSLVPNVSAENLRSSRAEIPEEILVQYLQLPDTMPERVVTFTQNLVEGQENSLDKIVTIQNYLRETVPYDLNTPMPAEGQDVVDYFLFEAPSGFCTYYASSMVVMLRVLDIPARVVTGYASGTYILEQGVFQVPGNLAHAWVEVYFPEFGWIPFEPTPSQDLPFYARQIISMDTSPMMSGQQARIRLFWLRTGGILLSGTGLLLFGWLTIRLLKQRRLISRQAKHPLMRLYYRLRYQLQSYGYPLLHNQTALEFWQDADEKLTGYPRIRTALQLGTDGVEKVLYSPFAVQDDEVKQMRAALLRCWPEWIKMGWHRAFYLIRRYRQQ